MRDNRRDQLIQYVEREFIGPDPIDWPRLTQDNGEEILESDPPRTRYIAGILYPQQVLDENLELVEGEFDSALLDGEISNDMKDRSEEEASDDGIEYLEDAEELINRSNSYRQSALSITVAIKDADDLRIRVTAGSYAKETTRGTEMEKGPIRYRRIPIDWDNENQIWQLPSKEQVTSCIEIGNSKLRIHTTYRYKSTKCSIFTFTLENNTDLKSSTASLDEACYFQTKLELTSTLGFSPMPKSYRISTDDEDYWSNQLLYRNAQNYAVGHGCAADWVTIEGKVHKVSTAIFPRYETKPIIANSIEGVSLEMLKMSDIGDFQQTMRELKEMCKKYQIWIDDLKEEINEIQDELKETAERHIKKCEICLERMNNGIDLLHDNSTVRAAFQYMNRAMLLQQLHYNLPLQKWIDNPKEGIMIDDQIASLPEITDVTTWYENGKRTYGKWRPFQLAFILMNLKSMLDKECEERGTIDLIWFPTGGGKTEAYLGLSAYTIFLRRLMSKNDSGTAILMRYTLRLLTAQQYQRAASMICACDIIRREHENQLGSARISIGLWVGGTTTPNSMADAVKAYESMYSKESNINPFVVLKCPWCGAQMGIVERANGQRELPGYKKITAGPRGQSRIIFQCRNQKHGCQFSSDGFSLPMHIVDEDIYESTPTLLLGTVDKFAMLPFRPKAQRLFGYCNGVKTTSPDLIIQDELHLISGPLGSMVGHYETLISELCSQASSKGVIHPKIVASTATISRAREQCHNLYGYDKEKIFQFPPSGLDAGTSFFAKEDLEHDGRIYVGILASGSSSDATTAIRLYASLLYGTKALTVSSENKRDPYWTNIGYYNSIRELGQAATWIRADIDQHLDVMYKRRYDHKRYQKDEYQQHRRYIWRDEELTSRIRSDRVTASLENLAITYPPEKNAEGKVKEHPIDICLATNMISVGLDVARLGLMTVAGQPKTTSEYIQATSRVGRDIINAPGIVFILYRPGRPRDKSHYEQFKSYHSRMYCNVEPTSVTPFSAPLRERALHAVLIGMVRLEANDSYNNDPPKLPNKETVDRVRSVVFERVNKIDKNELEATMKQVEHILQCWEDWQPDKFQDFRSGEELPLMFPSGSRRNEAWGKERSFPTPTSMRNVDATCEAYVLENRYIMGEE